MDSGAKSGSFSQPFGEHTRASDDSSAALATVTLHAGTLQGNAADYDTMFYNYNATRARAFLKDKTVSNTQLPKLLPKGIPYAANFISFDELQKKKHLCASKRDAVGISSEELRILYQAKCIDQNLPPSWEREVRFMELISANCKGNFFCLPENGFGEASAEAIAHILSANKVYSVLDLSGNRLRDEGAKFIADLLRVNRCLVHVGLSSNDVGYGGGVAIAEALEGNNTVVSLDLGARSGVNGNHIGTRGAEAIGRLLERNQVISKLNLVSNGLGPNGLSYIATGLAQNTTLTHLDISSNNLGYEGSRIIASVLEYAKITHLSLQRNALGDKGGKVLFQAIASAIETGGDVLEYLDVENNGFEAQCAAALQKVLTASTALTTLRLSGNHFSAAAKCIADGLVENKHLKHLHLCDADIREAEGASFGNALSINKTLHSLDLSRNKLKNEGAKGIAKGIAASKGLLKLNLSGNKIGDEGGCAIANALLTNSTLLDLNLRRNTMSSSTGELFNEYLRSNTTIEHMDVSYNDFSYKCFIGIKSSLEKNAHSNKLLIIPKLNNEIEVLAPKEKELAHVEEEIEMEKRTIKDRSEQLLRKNEEARVVCEKLRRDVVELDRVLERVRAASEAAEDIFRQEEEKFTNESASLKMKMGNLETRIQQEKDKQDRMKRDMDKMRKQIRQIEEAENEQLAPLISELAGTEADRTREMNDTKFEAEKLASLALRKKELEVTLGAYKKMGK